MFCVQRHYTLHAHGIIIYLSLNFHHICDIQDRVLCFWWCFLSPGKKRQMRRRRARSAFSSLTATPKPKKSLDEKFPYLYGERFF